MVIGGENHDNRIRVPTFDEQRGKPDAGGRVSAHGLANEIRSRKIRQLVLNQGGMLLAGNHELAVDGNQGFNSVYCFPEQTCPTQEA